MVLKDTGHPKLLSDMFGAIDRDVAALVARGVTLDEVRKTVNLDEYRKVLAGGSSMRSLLFTNYVMRPAVGAAYRQAGGK